MIKKYCKLLPLVASMLLPAAMHAQMTIGAASAPDSSALLDLRSANKGVLFPKVSLSNTAAWGLAGTTPQEAMIVYNSNASLAGTGANGKGYYYWSGTSWTWLSGMVSKAWSTGGNSGTDTTVNFLGNTDNHSLMFRINNTKSGMISQNNTAFGYQALQSGGAPYPTSGIENTAIGTSTLAANTGGSDNTALGYAALTASTGSANTSVGALALAANKAGNWNTALGYLALRGNTSGQYNVGIGISTLLIDSSGSFNIAIGGNALNSNKTGNYNIGLGYNVLTNATGSMNLAVGNYAGNNITSGRNNIMIGNSTAGSPNIVNASAPTASYEMNIGNTLFGTNIDSSVGVGRVGINVRNPGATLQVNGSMAINILSLSASGSYTITDNDYFISIENGATDTLYLPMASACKGRIIQIQVTSVVAGGGSAVGYFSARTAAGDVFSIPGPTAGYSLSGGGTILIPVSSTAAPSVTLISNGGNIWFVRNG